MHLPNNKYSIIYADPPWDYQGGIQYGKTDNKRFNNTGSASLHYNTVKTKDMMEWDIPSICNDDCLLFMWVTSPHLDQGIDLGKAWGFQYCTIAFVWHKENPNPGNYSMSECEVCLVFKRGKIPQPRGKRNVRQFLIQKKGKHSKKPDIIRNRIMAMFPTQSKIELFARERFDGWDAFGDEL